MAKYRVNVLGVQGINNKVYGPVDEKGKPNIVTDEHFPEGVAEKLCKEGKLILLEPKKVEKPIEVKKVEKSKEA